MKTTAFWPVHYTALSPIVHGSDEKAGNMSFARTLPYFDNGNRFNAPIIAGNAIRGKLRRIAARRVLESLDVKALSLPLYHLWFSGGAIEKGASKIAYDVGEIQELRSTFPYIGLFGGSFFNDIFPSTLRCEIINAVCKETEPFTGIPSDIAARELITQVFYTRRDDKHEDVKVEGADTSSQMIYEFEAIVPGTKLIGDIGVERATPLEVGCLADTFEAFASNPRLGGKSAIGHGKVRIDNQVEIPGADMYRNYMVEKADLMRDWLKRFGGRINEPESVPVEPLFEAEEAKDES